MKAEFLTKEKIVFFFNKYKYNSDLIIQLERRLLKESYNFEKWQTMLSENSKLTRRLFAENEELLDEYIRPAIEHPGLLTSEAVDTFLTHITFFLFENHLDSLVVDDLLSALMKRTNLTKRQEYDIYMNLGITRTVSGRSSFELCDSAFTKADAIFPTYEETDCLDSQIHIAFSYTFHLLSFCLYKSKDIKKMIQIYSKLNNIVRTGSRELYDAMWGQNSDIQFHIELLMRYMRIYILFAAEQIEFETDQESFATIKAWLEAEYKQEQKEGKINLMIWTCYFLLQSKINKTPHIDAEEIFSQKLELLLAENITNFDYPECAFPIDNDPVDPVFANLLNMMKLFNDSFSFTFMFLPALFKITRKPQLKKRISDLTRNYYEFLPYENKGFCIDNFVIDNFILIAQSFTTPDDCIGFLQTLFVHRQITSAIHFSMVGHIAFVCISHFIDVKPELFVGIPGLSSIDDVIFYKGQLLEFIRQAGFIHDIGKIGCTSVINLHSRHLTNREFGIIKSHTSLGNKIIQNIPLLKKFSHTILGHHRSWDGKNGYPDSFDSTSSPIKVLIDIISIADSIDAATDFLGRNYSSGKHFDDVLQELVQASGTMYSPDYIELLQNDEVLRSELKLLTETGRTSSYFDAYNKYVMPFTYFEAEEERSIDLLTPELKENLFDFFKVCYPDASDEKLNWNIQEYLGKKQTFTFVLHNKMNKICDIFSGHTVYPLENQQKEFHGDCIIILPELRRKGWATNLIQYAKEFLSNQNFNTIKMDVLQDFDRESFFWINGFSVSRTNQMEIKL